MKEQASAAPASPDELVAWLCAVIAHACQREPSSVSAGSSMVELAVDSLTLVSVLTRIEAAYDLELTPGETLALLDAPDVGALARVLAGFIPDARRRNASDGLVE